MIGARSLLCIAMLCVAYAGATTPQCPPNDPLGYTVHLPNPDDCNQFYRCDHGIAKPERCPAGLHFNAVLQVCDWPYSANCQAGSSTFAPTSPTTVSSTEQTEVAETTTAPTEWTSSTSSNPTTVSTTESTVYPPCPSISEAGVVIRFPHESNCKYYYICNNGYSTLYQCRTGYLFSPTQLKCVPNSESDCGSFSTSHLPTASTPEVTTTFEQTSPGTEEATSGASSSTFPTSTHETVSSTSATVSTTFETTITAEATTTHESTTSETSNTTNISACPVEDDPNNIIRFPHESVCYYYYLCRNGYPILYQCPNNLHFNPILKVCQDKNEAGCEQSSSTTPWVTEITSTDATTTENVETTEENSSQQTDEVTTQNTETTPEESVETTEHSTDPATENPPEITTSLETTPEGTTVTEIQTTVEQPLTCPPVDDPNVIIRIPHESVCYYYYICKKGELVLYQCPEGLHFNSTIRICQEKELAGCTLSVSSTTSLTDLTEDLTTTEEVGETTEVVPETTKENSSEVITEETTIGIGQTTEEDLITTEGVEETSVSHATTEVVPETTKDDSSEIITEETTIGIETTVDITETTESPTTEDNIDLTTVDHPSSCPAVDDPNVIIRIPHERVCYYYYICKKGEPVLYQCPAGFHFSPTLRICQEKEVAGCEHFSSTTLMTEGTEELTTTEEIVETTENPGGPGELTTTSSGSSTEQTTVGTTSDIDHVTEENTDGSENQATTDSDLNSATTDLIDFTTELTTESGTDTTTADQPLTCPPVDDPNVTIRIPHESVCYYYYICKKGELVLYQCPAGLHFNSSIRICQEKELAGCTLSVSSTTSLTDLTEDLTTTEEVAETTEVVPETTKEDSSEVITEETTIGIGQTTEEDLITTEEVEETSVSHATTEVVPETTKEDSSEVVTVETTISVETTTIEITETTESHVSPTTEDNIDLTTVDHPSSCPAVDDPNVIIRIPHERVCYYYYICKKGKPVLYQCPSGFHFSPTLRICKEKEVAGCEYFSSTTLMTEGTEDLTTTQYTEETSNNPEVTEGFTEATSEDAPDGTTLQSTTATELSTENTESHEIVTTEDVPVTTTDTQTTIGKPIFCFASDNPSVEVRLPHECVCYYYYTCKNGELVLSQCPDGLQFNPTTSVCQERELVGCEIISLSSTPSLVENTEPKPQWG